MSNKIKEAIRYDDGEVVCYDDDCQPVYRGDYSKCAEAIKRNAPHECEFWRLTERTLGAHLVGRSDW